ncbi:MAG: YggT family protein [Deltaproteobacteria bacterium]|nr:YggT family protein [Deltaproteobacteria bacterium]
MEEFFHFLADLSWWALYLYEWILFLAIFMTWIHPDPSNPVVRFLNGMTLPFWRFLGRILPGRIKLFAPYVSLLMIWLLEIVAPGVLHSLATYTAGAITGGDLGIRTAGFLMLGVGVVTRNFLMFIILLLLVWFFITLLSPSVHNPVVQALYFLVDPFITPLQKRLPRTRIDFSPLVMSGILLLLVLFIITPFTQFSHSLTRTRGMELQLPNESGELY